MKNNFVTYEIALKLKELGFDEECLTVYNDDKELESIFNVNAKDVESEFLLKDTNKDLYCKNSELSTYVTALLWQQAILWFKLNHKILITELWNGWEFAKEDEDFVTCETLEQTILKAIELINK